MLVCVSMHLCVCVHVCVGMNPSVYSGGHSHGKGTPH